MARTRGGNEEGRGDPPERLGGLVEMGGQVHDRQTAARLILSQDLVQDGRKQCGDDGSPRSATLDGVMSRDYATRETLRSSGVQAAQ